MTYEGGSGGGSGGFLPVDPTFPCCCCLLHDFLPVLVTPQVFFHLNDIQSHVTGGLEQDLKVTDIMPVGEIPFEEKRHELHHPTDSEEKWQQSQSSRDQSGSKWKGHVAKGLQSGACLVLPLGCFQAGKENQPVGINGVRGYARGTEGDSHLGSSIFDPLAKDLSMGARESLRDIVSSQLTSQEISVQ